MDTAPRPRPRALVAVHPSDITYGGDAGDEGAMCKRLLYAAPFVRRALKVAAQRWAEEGGGARVRLQTNQGGGRGPRIVSNSVSNSVK